jgi:hypothetical protein
MSSLDLKLILEFRVVRGCGQSRQVSSPVIFALNSIERKRTNPRATIKAARGE